MVDPLRQKYGSRARVLLPLLLGAFVALSAWRMWPDRQAAAPTRPDEPELVTLEGPTMGTTWRVTLVVEGARGTDAVGDTILAELAEIDRQMSNYRDDSVLAALNVAPAGPFPAPPALLQVLARAREVSERSGGAFDVTVAPLVDAWGFGRVKRPDARPGEAEIEALRARVGWRGLEVDLAAGTLLKRQPDVVVDLSAIAPGYAADALSERLVALGFARHLVDVGGEMRIRGEGPSGPWRLGVERPGGPADARVVQEVVALREGALATSGDYRNYREQDGVRLSHTIDPRSGRPIAHALASVTLVHREAALADAWATALNVLGPEEGLHLAATEGLAALFLVREEDGFVARTTPAWDRLRAESGPVRLDP